MTETQQRFLRAIAERMPMEQVVEVHLFPPIRQGGVETCVAVVAENPRRPVVIDVTAAQADGAEVVDASLEQISEAAEIDGDPTEAAAIDVDEPEDDGPYADELEMAASDDDDLTDDDDIDVDDSDDDDDEDEESVEPEPQADGDGIAAEDLPATPAARFIIHTARYRLTLKGVDRGKWEVDVVAEADAPLDAVEAVIRGVQRRSGEGAEPDRLTTDAFREALDAPLAQLER